MKLQGILLLIVCAIFLLATKQSAFAADPWVGKLGINFHLVPHYDKPEWTWTPTMRFRIYGPIVSSDSVWVEYTYPNGKPFLKVQCENVSAIEADDNIVVNDCGYRQEDSAATNVTGLFSFQMKIVNGLNGTTRPIFSGKFNVGRTLYNPDKLPDRNKQFYYYVDHDWRLPIAYVGTFYGDTSNDLLAEVWVKTPIKDNSKVGAYLMFNGKQVAEAWGSFTLRATPPETPSQEYHLMQFHFHKALVERPPSQGWDDFHKLYQNPGEYEVKVLRDGKLSRSFKFTIGKDGKPVDAGGFVKSNMLAKEGAIVPAQVLGDGDGVWNKTAWRTDAIWANPVNGFVVP